MQESRGLGASTGCPATSRRWWYLPYAVVAQSGRCWLSSTTSVNYPGTTSLPASSACSIQTNRRVKGSMLPAGAIFSDREGDALAPIDRAQLPCARRSGEVRVPELQTFESKRLRRRSEMSWPVSPRVAKSAMISPTTLQNLNPWPEKPAARKTFGEPGKASMMKCPSGVFVNMQGCRDIVGPFASGK